VNGFAQDDTGVDVALSNGRSLRAQYLVGCDGGRSLIRKAAGIAFPGSDPTTSNLIAEVEMAETPEWGIHHSAFGVHSFGRKEYQIVDGKIVYADRGPVGVLVTEQHVGPATEPTLAISARLSSPHAGRTTGSIAPSGSPGSPMQRGRPRPTARDGC